MDSVYDIVSYNPGDVVLYPGTPRPRDPLYRVKEGLLRLETINDEGDALTLRFVRPGEYFGEEILSGGTRGYFAEAVIQSKVELIEPQNISPAESSQITEHLVNALGQTYRTIQRLSSQRLKNRIAAALLELADTPLGFEEIKGLSGVKATHDELAAAVGSVRETVTKVVGELVREGYLQSGYGKLTFLNPEGLKSLAQQAA